MILAITRDELVLRNLERIGEVESAYALGEAPQNGGGPAAVVIDLDVKDAVAVAAQAKARWADALIAGFLSYPDRKLWQAADAAGFDLVTTRGALATQLQSRLKTWQGRSKERVPVCDVADLAGRLGVIARLDNLPMGPIAVYHVGGQVFAAQDVCPHAGARLSEGDITGAIVTCPRHGSQFDVRNGERLRGPADIAIKTFRVEIDGGQVYVVKDEGDQGTIA